MISGVVVALDSAASFEAVVSAWDELPRCDVDTTGGIVQCSRPARWRADFHGCSRGVMCTEHMQAWTQKIGAALSGGMAPCKWCGKMFASADDALTVTAL